MDSGGAVPMGLNDLHHRSLEVRDYLFRGEKLLLTRRGKPLASIKPVAVDIEFPRDAQVRSITYIRRHKREFVLKIMEGQRILLTYRGKTIGIVDPELS
ncbi:MAG: hypothetical protein SWK76_00470 [Actinomycetota bacterium]|nr:hypothetical protein [Actinomycetota bacterium]